MVATPPLRDLSAASLASRDASPLPQPAVISPPPIPAPLVAIPAAKLGPSPLASVASLVAFVASDFGLKKAFVRAGLTFPSSLAGMVGLFAGEIGGSGGGGKEERRGGGILVSCTTSMYLLDTALARHIITGNIGYM